VNHVRVFPTGQNRFNLRLVAEKEFADYQELLRLRNAAKKKELETLGKVEKVEKEKWKPPDPWVYSNKENIYVSNLESDKEETHSSQGYIRQRGRRKKKPEPSHLIISLDSFRLCPCLRS
jgi:hypothetical protein